MPETLATENVFPPVVSTAVEEAATDFFQASCGLRHIPTAQVDESGPCAGIMSTISFLGDLQWAFALAFPDDAAVAIAKAFAGFDIPFDSPDMADVLGEIANVIAGDISARLAKQGIKAQMSLPTVVRGGNVSLLVPHSVSTTRVTFSGPGGTCWFNLVGTRTDGLTFRRSGA